MKKIIAIALVALVAAAVQADVWTEDFSTSTLNLKTGGDVYLGDSGYGVWGGISSAIYNASGIMVLNTGVNLQTVRGAGVRLSSAELGTGLDGTFTYDVVNVNNHADTRLYIEIWEVKDGTQGVYMDLMRPLGSAPIAATYGTGAILNDLGGNVYAAADDNLVGELISFTRTDSTADIVIMFGVGNTRTFSNTGTVDNISVTVIPEPATALLFGIGGLGAFMIRRNRQKAQEETDA